MLTTIILREITIILYIINIMGKTENIRNYYKKKHFEKMEKERENSMFKSKTEYDGNWDKAFHNLHMRQQGFKGLIEEFKVRMEQKFTDGMSWKNYGEWEVDHIIPLSKGGAHSVENLQPLWMKENRSKSNKIL